MFVILIANYRVRLFSRQIEIAGRIKFIAMKYKIIDIEGVGETYAEKLTIAGIDTVEKLLERGATPSGRARIAAEAGIPEKLILRWTNHADLFRVNGVGPQFAELLEAAGVDTVKELRHRKAENLAVKLEEVNAARNLTGRVPSVKELQRIIDDAAALDPMLTY